MHRLFLSRHGAGSRIEIRGLRLALAAGLALTASACMTPSAKQSSAAGSAGERAAKAETGAKSGAEDKKKTGGKSLSWWQRLTRSQPEPKEKPWVYGDVRPGKGLLGGDEHGTVLYRQGEGQSSSASGKPEKVRR